MTLPPLQGSRISATDYRLDSCDASNTIISRNVMLTTLQRIYEGILLTSKTNTPTLKREIYPTIHAVVILIFSLWQRVWLYHHCAGLRFRVKRGSLKMCVSQCFSSCSDVRRFFISLVFPKKFSLSLNIKAAGLHWKQLLILNFSE